MTKNFAFVLIILVLALAACQPQLGSLDQRVADTPNEILYHEPVIDNVRSSDMQFFGIGLADTVEDIESLHGPADVREEYNFGRIVNLEYRFGQNKSVVLYHTELGYVRGILLTENAPGVLQNPNLLGHTRSHVYGALGTPTVLNPLLRETQMIYDPLGYEIYMRSGKVNRIYFSLPDRGVKPAGQDVEGVVIPEDEAETDTSTTEQPEGTQSQESEPVSDVSEQQSSEQESSAVREEDSEPENSAPTLIFG